MVNIKLKWVMLISCLFSPSIVDKVEKGRRQKITNTTTTNTWLTPYLEYLIQGVIPINKDEAQKITNNSKNYAIIQGAF